MLARFLPLLAVAACGPAPLCEDYVGKEVGTGKTSGTATLSAAGDSATQRYRVTIRGLPELWGTTSPVRNAFLTTNVVERYVSGNPGGDGVTQMPHLMTSFGDQPPQPTGPFPPYFPGSAPVALGSQLIDCNNHAEHACCAMGSTGCEFTGTLFVTRLDGEPFPPVTVDWETSASITVAQCPIASGPELDLTPESEP